MSIPWPAVFSEFLNVLKVALLDILTLTRTGCATPLSFYGTLLITLTMFAGGSLFGFVVLVAADAAQRRKERQVHEAIQAAVSRTSSYNVSARRSRQTPTHVGQESGGFHDQDAPVESQRRKRQPRRESVVMASLATAVAMPKSLMSMRWGRVFKSLALFWTLCYPGA